MNPRLRYAINWTDEEMTVAEQAVRNYQADNVRKRSQLQAAADRLAEAAKDMERIWVECVDYTGDAFRGSWGHGLPEFGELVQLLMNLKVAEGYEFGTE